jgi:predicted ATPase
MFFRVIENLPPQGQTNCAYLIRDYWDDWFQFRTMFTLMIFDEAGKLHRAGSVKIGRLGLRPGREPAPGQRSPEIPEEFEALADEYFSLGQGEDYYQTLNELSQGIRERVLIDLRDCAYNLEIFQRARNEPSMNTSLLRGVSSAAVEGRLHRLTQGDAELTEFYFQYTLPQSQGIQPPTLVFEVTPESEPPTNVHVLIGRNGVGKTRAMRHLIEALLERHPENTPGAPQVILLSENEANESFAGLILISFSAFDDFDLLPRRADRIPAEQVGLRHRITADEVEHATIKTPTDLAIDFRKSLERCRSGLRAERWRAAVATLESDDLFAEANVTSLLDLADDGWTENAEHLFSLLSSGHAIVLLTITRLVELVDEKTLVLLDEPEAHLHPPLLAAFIRCLSDLLVKRNGVAIVATHSPVVLQEVPRSCAWKLRRSGAVSVAERPAIETFGENIGILTREVFGFEVTRAGFHNLLDVAVNTLRLNYEAVLARFGGQLGAEARAIVRALIAERDNT